MDLTLYLKPTNFSKFKPTPWIQSKFSLGSILEKNQAKLSLDKAQIVLLGVEEDRNAVVTGSAKAPNIIRQHLFNLNRISPRFKILDLGNIKTGKTPNDTYFALRDVCSYLLEIGKTVVILGGSQDLTFGITKAFEATPFNLVNIDPKLDYKKGVKSINSETYLNFIHEKQPCLYAQTILGYQNYFIDSLELDYCYEQDIDVKRLGEIRYEMAHIEPYLRDTDILSFDINAIRQLEAPAQYFGSPNGLYAEEACQIGHYAGMADQLKIAGFFNLIPHLDTNELSSKLMAQVVWHFLEGFYFKKVEQPTPESEDFNEFLLEIDDIDLPLAFYQSHQTGRWWMKIADEENQYERMIACTEEDYKMAAQHEIPDRWWKNIRKLNRLTK
ncbi:arginase family protein [Sunxiuqinia elliptica]|uniref:Arginase family enzyme n=1 Tax=Sunxiuqinia elliptica TaxID=655355 RepID=A0A1I2C0L8_9BACT|nr:arginase family protein [Sunxiuqinia elliptica]SFE61732.1 Arginase family enzyme [Sunxiuqinia elliptica]